MGCGASGRYKADGNTLGVQKCGPSGENGDQLFLRVNKPGDADRTLLKKQPGEETLILTASKLTEQKVSTKQATEELVQTETHEKQTQEEGGSVEAASRPWKWWKGARPTDEEMRVQFQAHFKRQGDKGPADICQLRTALKAAHWLHKNGDAPAAICVMRFVYDDAIMVTDELCQEEATEVWPVLFVLRELISELTADPAPDQEFWPEAAVEQEDQVTADIKPAQWAWAHSDAKMDSFGMLTRYLRAALKAHCDGNQMDAAFEVGMAITTFKQEAIGAEDALQKITDAQRVLESDRKDAEKSATKLLEEAKDAVDDLIRHSLCYEVEVAHQLYETGDKRGAALALRRWCKDVEIRRKCDQLETDLGAFVDAVYDVLTCLLSDNSNNAVRDALWARATSIKQ